MVTKFEPRSHRPFLSDCMSFAPSLSFLERAPHRLALGHHKRAEDTPDLTQLFTYRKKTAKELKSHPVIVQQQQNVQEIASSSPSTNQSSRRTSMGISSTIQNEPNTLHQHDDVGAMKACHIIQNPGADSAVDHGSAIVALIRSARTRLTSALLFQEPADNELIPPLEAYIPIAHTWAHETRPEEGVVAFRDLLGHAWRLSLGSPEDVHELVAAIDEARCEALQVEVEDTVPGTGTIAVTTGDVLGVTFTGWTLSLSGAKGAQFSSNAGSALYRFQLGSPGIIAGWSVGLLGMRKGGTRVLRVPSHLAYGANPPAGSGIPPNANLLFEIHLERMKRGRDHFITPPPPEPPHVLDPEALGDGRPRSSSTSSSTSTSSTHSAHVSSPLVAPPEPVPGMPSLPCLCLDPFASRQHGHAASPGRMRAHSIAVAPKGTEPPEVAALRSNLPALQHRVGEQQATIQALQSALEQTRRERDATKERVRQYVATLHAEWRERCVAEIKQAFTALFKSLEGAFEERCARDDILRVLQEHIRRVAVQQAAALHDDTGE
eukprot:gnl/Trimastix_PCT/2522.p1 GENE.gnl/Trimastix_PCT/2522~~gnl/Trimastix_PCT/2522.p1  ORF type:complete len:548 (+),score=129.19 gnl/Trimastix_PCT/2522:16-1659(+)